MSYHPLNFNQSLSISKEGQIQVDENNSLIFKKTNKKPQHKTTNEPQLEAAPGKKKQH